MQQANGGPAPPRAEPGAVSRGEALGMAADLGLSVQDGGNIVGALGLAWGVFAIFSGRISDKIGHRKVLIPAILLFSLLSG